MDPQYRITDTSNVFTPALVVYRDMLLANLDRMVELAGGVGRLRPHCKTHKMPEVTRLELARGITKHKCATLAEAEMLAEAGVNDIFLSYNIVGPNIGRCVRFLQRYPSVGLKVQADHEKPITELGAAMTAAGLTIEVLLDLDVGQHRTGVAAGPEAVRLYKLISTTPGLVPGGLHVYDGHQQQVHRGERTAAVMHEWSKVTALRADLTRANLRVSRIVCGGTGSFPVYAAITDPLIELSPGTCVFNDAGYSDRFPDLKFPPAVALLTRVVSRPTTDRVTCDLGYKAVASDPPAGKRLVILDVPDAEQVLQNEEHLVVKTALAERFSPGDELYAIPWHICPSSALHKQVYVVAEGRVVEQWEVTGRDRCITI